MAPSNGPIGPSNPPDSSLAPTHLAPVPSAGQPQGAGVRRGVHSPPALGPRARHPKDCTTDYRAGGVWGGPPPDQGRHPVGPGRMDLAPAPARRDRPTDPLVLPCTHTRPFRRTVAFRIARGRDHRSIHRAEILV